MAQLEQIKEEILKMLPEEALKDTTWEYGFKFNYDKEIKKVAYATNFTPFTIKKAVEVGADLLITHHDAWPFMNKQKEFCNELLEQYELNHCFFHTPLDVAKIGTSSSLAKELKLTDTKPAVPYRGHLVGIVGKTKKQSFETLIAECEKVLNEKVRFFKNNDNLISKVLIVTGGGNETSMLDNAIKEKCDTYITGEYNMYLQHYAEFHKINLVIGSHTKTEIIGVRNFVKEITKKVKGINTVEINEPSY